jgi:hypothetical protein
MDSGLLWLAVHGSTIGITAFLTLVVGGFFLWPGLRRILIRFRARRLRGSLGEPLAEGLATHLDDVVTIRGHIRAGDKKIEADDDLEELRGAVAATLEMSPILASTRQRAPELWLDASEERVELDGDVEVILGARELYPATDEGGLTSSDDKPVRFPKLVSVRWIDEGSVVRARGVLGRVPTSADDGTYRSAGSSQLSLRPPKGGGPSSTIAVAADRTPQVIGSPWAFTSTWVALGVGGASVFVTALFFWLVGSLSLHVARTDRSYTAAAVASAVPLAREEAIDWMAESLEEGLEQGSPAVESYLTLRRIQYRQVETFPVLMAAQCYEQAARVAIEVGHVGGVRSVAQQLARRGEFDRASHWYASSRMLSSRRHEEGWREEVITHLLAGRLTRAADLTALEARNDTGHRRCIADAIAARAGDEQAFGQLIERAALTPELAECQLLRADVVPVEARLAALDQCRECTTNPRWARTAWLLRYEALLAIDAGSAERARAADEATFYVTSSYLQFSRSRDVQLVSPGLEQSVLREIEALEPASLAPEERRFLERLAYSVGVFDQLTRPTDSATLPAHPSDDIWRQLWPEPLWTMAELSAYHRVLTSDGDEEAIVVGEALDRFHDALSVRETAVLIDVFAAW